MAYASTGENVVSAKTVEEVASVSTGGSGVNARSAFRKSLVDVLCLMMWILICKAEWLSSVRPSIKSNTQMVRSSKINVDSRT